MKREYKVGMLTLTIMLSVVLMASEACYEDNDTAASGIERVAISVPKQSNGLTIEQQNVADRLATDNLPGSIKHLYVISAMSGDVLMYSTVRGKVTSSGKRLSPYQTTGGQVAMPGREAIGFSMNGERFLTNEILQDDGTYGSSVPYLYWWDAQGRYHQHYVAGGQILHISDQPIMVGRVVLNLSPEEG